MIQQPASIFMFSTPAEGDEVMSPEAMLSARLHGDHASDQAIFPEHLLFAAIWLGCVLLGAWRLLH